MHFISHIMRINSLALLFILGFYACEGQEENLPAKQVLNRVIGHEHARRFVLELIPDNGSTGAYSIEVDDNKVMVRANTQVALCRGAYDYLRNEC